MPKSNLTVVDVPPAPAIERLVQDYLQHLHAMGRAPKTREAYRYPLTRLLLPFCAREGVTDPGKIDNRLVDKLAVEIQERGLSPFSVASYIRHLRIFLRWAQGEGEVPGKVDMKAPKQPKRDLRGLTLTEQEVKAMADEAVSPRDELIVRLLFYTGIRLGELRQLRDGDLIDLPQGGVALKVRGKTGERLVPLPPTVNKLLGAWLRKRPKTVGGWIFPTIRKNRVGEYGPLAARTVETVVHDLAASAGITKRVHPHLFRHSFATWWLNKGGNPVDLQRILGHGSMEMIASWYSHQTDDDNYSAMLRVLQASTAK
jgi:integrase